MKLKAIDFAVLAALVFCIISTVSFEKSCQGIRQEVIRLHVIANSDSDCDQQLKLYIRDALINKTQGIFTKCTDIISAEKSIKSSMSLIKEIALECAEEYGCEENIAVTLGRSYFPTRVYDDITLPAGYYKALKVIIGKGEGKNWWCVMFPQLCLPGTYKKTELLEKALNDREMEIVLSPEKYEVKFWLVEKYYDFKRAIMGEN